MKKRIKLFGISCFLLLTGYASIQSAWSEATLKVPVYNVKWKVCNVLNPYNISQRTCLQNKEVLLVWADKITPQDVKLVKKRSFISGVQNYLFVRSKGCINNYPGSEDFYYTDVVFQMGDIRKESTLPKPVVTIAPSQLPNREAVIEVARAFRLARSPKLQVGTTGKCLSLSQWTKFRKNQGMD
ncbi:MAG: hypothetical protein SAK29_21805 [Scytonema sp. PMC 1069.18]|nr:hypothetical protein [Scytonema sp. PMC 1069.18]MEC4880951.1 hypothetical protein [Scytonema sp. PMC 1070.18]